MVRPAGPDRPVFHGRRHGRKLSPKALENLEWALDRYGIDPGNDPGSAAGRLDPASLFEGNGAPLFLEIGFGGGEHLAARAAENPGARFIGAEPFINGIAKLARNIREAELGNIRVWPEDVRLLLPKLPEAALDGAFILFPDPWPKYRHRERRILQPRMIGELARLIRPGGSLLLASDHATAKSWILSTMLEAEAFEWLAGGPADWREPPEGWPGTRYGAKAERQGRRSSWFPYRRR